ncbi:hypothetical protein D3C72_640150 [compost metagenome]
MKSSFWYLPAGCLGAMLFLSGCTVDTAALANVINQVQTELQNAKATTAGGTGTGTGTGQALVDDAAPPSDGSVAQTDRPRPQGGMRPGGAPPSGQGRGAEGDASPDVGLDEPASDQPGAMPAGRPRQRR